MKLAVISLGGKSSKDVAKEAKAFFTEIDSINLKDLDIEVDSKKTSILHKGKKLNDYDCIYLRGSYRYATLLRSLTRALHKDTYLPIKPKAFTIGHNKFLTLIELQKHKVPIPTTYITATTEGAKKLIENVHFPIIIKIPGGTHGKGVMFADSISSARSVLDALEVFNQPYIIQEYIETNATDIRIIVAKDKVIAAMKRKATKEELRANIHAGGKGYAYVPDYDTEQIAIKAAKATGADICAVDIVEGKEPLVIEVNLSPSTQGITKATKKNVAQIIAKSLAEQTKEFLIEKQKQEEKITPEEEVKKQKTKTKELLTSLDIKAGIIKLPKIVADLTNFKPDDEVIFKMEKGKLKIERHEIKKDLE